MDNDQREELEALCVAYLTQNLKDFPNGVTIDYFEKTFPEKMDENRDWYRRNFKLPTVLAALQEIPTAVRLTRSGGSFLVTLNKSSDKVDSHLVSLVVGQKASNKRRRPTMSSRTQSQRVNDAFALNRRSSNSSSYRTENRFRSQFESNQNRYGGYPGSGPGHKASLNNHDTSHYQNKSTMYSARSNRSAHSDLRSQSNDPRLVSSESWPAPRDPRSASRNWASIHNENKITHPSPAPQVRPMTTATLSSATPPKQPLNQSTSRPAASVPTPRPHVATPTTRVSYGTLGDEVKATADIQMEKKKILLRQNLVDLLTRKFDSLKIFYLASIYKDEYKTELDPTLFGHKTITDLLKDPCFREHIKIIPGHPYQAIKAVIGGESKENIASRGSNGNATTGAAEPFSERTGNISASKARLNAIDPFNVRTMLQSLEPLKDIKLSLGNLPIEDTVKYRTMRIIYKSPGMMLKLDDWERQYQIEWNLRIRIDIKEYGCKTLLQFFQKMAQDIPIKIRLVNDEWVAKSDIDSVSKWLNKSLEEGKFRAIMVMDKQYDYIAYPGETYPVFDAKNLKSKDYYPAAIMSVNYPHKMWLQIKTTESITALLAIETSLTSYIDYKRKNTFPVPVQFIKIGFPCVAYDEVQQRWCRAAITEVPEKLVVDPTVTVFLIDYGVSKHVKKSQLQCILKTHLAQPVGLIYAQLHGVDKNGEKMAKMTLQEFTNPPVLLACKILSSMHTPGDDVDIRWQSRKSIYNVTLVDTRLGTDQDIATAINSCTSFVEDVE